MRAVVDVKLVGRIGNHDAFVGESPLDFGAEAMTHIAGQPGSGTKVDSAKSKDESPKPSSAADGAGLIITSASARAIRSKSVDDPVGV